MARISGIDLPRNKKIEVALQYIFGIGKTKSQKILNKTQNIATHINILEIYLSTLTFKYRVVGTIYPPAGSIGVHHFDNMFGYSCIDIG